jgi:flagellar motor switch protein FliN/FliY
MTENNKNVVVGENLSSNKGKEFNKLDFDELARNPSNVKFNPDIFGNIPVNVTVVLGGSSISLQKVLQLSKGDIVELEKNIGDNVDLIVNGQLIAQGEVVAVGENYGVKVNKVFNK